MQEDEVLDKQCSHIWAHLETIKSIRDGGYRSYIYTKTDRFFCIKCLEEKNIKKEEYKYGDNMSDSVPEWY